MSNCCIVCFIPPSLSHSTHALLLFFSLLQLEFSDGQSLFMHLIPKKRSTRKPKRAPPISRAPHRITIDLELATKVFFFFMEERDSKKKKEKTKTKPSLHGRELEIICCFIIRQKKKRLFEHWIRKKTSRTTLFLTPTVPLSPPA